MHNLISHPQEACELETTFIPILQMRKESSGEVR